MGSLTTSPKVATKHSFGIIEGEEEVFGERLKEFVLNF